MQPKKLCNICGKELDFFDRQANLTIHKRLGYGSVHDGSSVHLKLCCDCFDKLVNACKVSPISDKPDGINHLRPSVKRNYEPFMFTTTAEAK